ncbi:MAG: dephospho-CoA kinase [Bacillota bacterium]
MFVIGLTGNIASGKSTVSEILQSLGAAIIDADKVAREIVEPGTPGLDKIAACFGREVLRPDGTLDREKLGRRVFNDPAELDRLNTITHPLILENIRAKLDKLERSGDIKAAVIDAPLLIETGLHQTVDELWVVTVDPAIQIKRVTERDNLSREEAAARIASQMPQEEKARLADVVIDNSGTPGELRAAVENLWRRRFGS